MALQALMDVISDELRSLEKNSEYNDAQNKIFQLQQKALDKLSKTLFQPLKIFLPNLKEIKIIKNNLDIIERPYRSDIDIIVNDGTPTSISFKGEGIKSLATLAILKERQNTKGASIIAIEEPESHLHSGAIHSLCEVINNISKNSQVILTTHNPLFVQQNYIKSNIIVDKGKAYPAKNISEIREILGVLPADNLKNANKVLVVEGGDDAVSIKKILSLKSDKISSALKNNLLVIQPTNGAGNLPHTLYDLQRSLCKYVVLLDNDSAGKEAYDKACLADLLTPAEIKFTICNGSSESEFEDCINQTVYQQLLKSNFGVDIDCKEFHTDKKWSDRLRNVFLSQGSQWNENIEKKVKYLVANNLPDDINKILIPQKSGFIDGLITIITSLLDMT